MTGNRTTLRKVLIVPYFGQLPEWFDLWAANTERMKDHGYDFLHDDEASFRDRVRDKLGIEPPPMADTGRVWNFRPAFGLLYENEIRDFHFWGHCDFDMVFGRVERWYTDDYLDSLDITANCHDYISGPWTLYRNHPIVNSLFLQTEEWKHRMEGSDCSHGWAEKGFTAIVDAAHKQGAIRRRYDYFQTRNLDDFSACRLLSEGRLMEGEREIAMLHFRRTKQWPEGCK